MAFLSRDIDPGRANANAVVGVGDERVDLSFIHPSSGVALGADRAGGHGFEIADHAQINGIRARVPKLDRERLRVRVREVDA